MYINRKKGVWFSILRRTPALKNAKLSF